MADLNHVMLIGRLTRDAELKYTPNGFAVANISLATNRRRKNGDQWVEEVSYFDVSLFGKSAEGLKQYLTKGKQIAVDGELRQDRWEQDGQSRSRVIINANNVQLLGGNTGNPGSSNGNYQQQGQQNNGNYSQGGGYQQQNNGYQQQNYQNSYEPGPAYSANDSDFSEDIPF